MCCPATWLAAQATAAVMPIPSNAANAQKIVLRVMPTPSQVGG